MTTHVRTRVAIIGAGPAGLLLSHLLAADGIESVVIDQRSREEIETTIRAGILEQGTVDLLVDSGASDRVLTVGNRHDGIELRFEGEGHRIDFPSLAGGQDLRLGVTAERVEDATSDHPRVITAGPDGEELVIEADFVVGADGSRSVARAGSRPARSPRPTRGWRTSGRSGRPTSIASTTCWTS